MSRGKWAFVIVAVCLVVTVAAVAYAAGQVKAAKVLRAERFELVDAEGQTRGVLQVDKEGFAEFRLFSPVGEDRAIIRASNDIATIGLLGGTVKDGTISLMSSPQISTINVLANNDSGTRQGSSAMFALREGMAGVTVFDKQYKRIGMRTTDDGNPSLEVSDSNHRVRAALGCTNLETMKTGETRQTAESSLVLFDKEGKVMWKAP